MSEYSMLSHDFPNPQLFYPTALLFNYSFDIRTCLLNMKAYQTDKAIQNK